MVIDWSKFDGKFVKLESDVRKQLVVTGWREGESKYEGEPTKPAIVFDVLSEDGEPVNKEFKASALRLVLKLRPLIEGAEKEGRHSLSFSIVKTGKGTGTNYVVEEVHRTN